MTAAWHLDDDNAELQHGSLACRINVVRPADGLRLDSQSLFAGANLLGVEIPPPEAGTKAPPIDKHVRGSDLILAYRPTADWPVHLDVLWRALSLSQEGLTLSAVELQVSVRTDLLDSRPELGVRSALSADRVLRLADAGASRFKPLSLDGSPVLGPANGPCCLIFRQQDADMSYVEMVHPADFCRGELIGGAGRDRQVQVRHHLFPQSLEKGVILRARVRGLFCPRDADEAIATEAYRSFAAAAPPLGG